MCQTGTESEGVGLKRTAGGTEVRMEVVCWDQQHPGSLFEVARTANLGRGRLGLTQGDSRRPLQSQAVAEVVAVVELAAVAVTDPSTLWSSSCGRDVHRCVGQRCHLQSGRSLCPDR